MTRAEKLEYDIYRLRTVVDDLSDYSKEELSKSLSDILTAAIVLTNHARRIKEAA